MKFDAEKRRRGDAENTIPGPGEANGMDKNLDSREAARTRRMQGH
jgi:hypothetical protein